MVVHESTSIYDNQHDKDDYKDVKNGGNNEILGGRLWSGVIEMVAMIWIIGSSSAM